MACKNFFTLNSLPAGLSITFYFSTASEQLEIRWFRRRFPMINFWRLQWRPEGPLVAFLTPDLVHDHPLLPLRQVVLVHGPDVGNPIPVSVEGSILSFHLLNDLFLPIREWPLVFVFEPHHVPDLVRKVQLGYSTPHCPSWFLSHFLQKLYERQIFFKLLYEEKSNTLLSNLLRPNTFHFLMFWIAALMILSYTANRITLTAFLKVKEVPRLAFPQGGPVHF